MVALYHLLWISFFVMLIWFIYRSSSAFHHRLIDEYCITKPILIEKSDNNKRYPIASHTTIGRSDKCDITIHRNDNKISRVQAVIFRHAGQGDPVWYIENVGRAWIKVNDKRLEKGAPPIPLQSQSTIQLRNEVEYKYQEEQESEANGHIVALKTIIRRRLIEWELLGYVLLTLALGLLAVDTGMRIELPVENVPRWDWIPLWMWSFVGWAICSALLLLGDFCHYWRHSQEYSRQTLYYPAIALIPILAMFVSIATIAGYRGETIPLNREHAQRIWEDLQKGERFWNAEAQQFERRNALDPRCYALAERAQAMLGQIPSMESSNADASTYSRICEILKSEVNMPIGGTMAMLRQTFLAIFFVVIGSRFLIATLFWRTDLFKKLRMRFMELRVRFMERDKIIFRSAQKYRLFSYLYRLFSYLQRNNLFIVVAAPVTIIIISLALLVLEFFGLASRIHGQLLSVRGLGQPSEYIRLGVMVFVAWMVARFMLGRMSRQRLVGAIAALFAGLGFYFWATRDLGPIIITALVVTGLCSLAVPRKAWIFITVIMFFVMGIALWQADRVQQSLTDFRYGQVRLWLDRPARGVSPDEYEAFCQQDVWHKNLCAGDASLRQAQYAIAAGGLFGTGPGRGLTIPPAGASVLVSNIHSDYIFILILEELGSLGGGLLICLFLALILLNFRSSQWLQNSYWRVFSAAAGFWWAVHVMVNIGGVTRLLPLIGIPLPFLSYGRTAIVINCIIFAIQLIASTQQRVSHIQVKNMKNQFSFGSMRGLITFCLISLALWFSLLMYIPDIRILEETLRLAQVTPQSTQYTALTHESQMGRRAICAVTKRAQQLIMSSDGQFLTEPYIYGCNLVSWSDAANKAGIRLIVEDATINNSLFLSRLERGPLTLTINLEIQKIVHDSLTAGLGENPAVTPRGQALVMDLEGRIVALVDSSGQYGERKANLFNGLYVPGSIMKIVTTLAALNDGMRLDDKIVCVAGATIMEKTIRNSLGDQNCRYAGETTNLEYALAYSVNTFFSGLTDVAQYNRWPEHTTLPVSRDDFVTAARAFGFEETSINHDGRRVEAPYHNYSLPVIASSIGWTHKGWLDFLESGTVWADTSYGQGNSQVTIFQVAAMMQVIANDGIARTPRLIDERETRNRQWEKQRIPTETANQLRALLYQTVSLAHQNHPPGIPFAGAAAVFIEGRQVIGGKTGTAEIQTVDGQPLPPIKWFAGFIDEPTAQYIVVVMVSQDAFGNVQPCDPAAIAGVIFERILGNESYTPCINR